MQMIRFRSVSLIGAAIAAAALIAALLPAGARIVSAAVPGSGFPETGTVLIDYKETPDGENGISGAEFTLYKTAEIGSFGEKVSLIRNAQNDPIEMSDRTDTNTIFPAVKNAYAREQVKEGTVYRGKTDKNGMLRFSKVEAGVYLVAETAPAAGYTASMPGLVVVPYTEEQNGQYFWNDTVTVMPKAQKIVRSGVSGGVPKTGDDRPLLLWAGAGLLSLFTGVFLLKKERRRRQCELQEA